MRRTAGLQLGKGGLEKCGLKGGKGKAVALDDPDRKNDLINHWSAAMCRNVGRFK